MTGRCSAIRVSSLPLSGPYPMKLYLFLRVNSISPGITPYSCISTTTFSLTVELLTARWHKMMSMISTTPSPSFSFYTYSSGLTSRNASLPMFCMYSVRTSNSFYSFTKRFSVSLASTRIL